MTCLGCQQLELPDCPVVTLADGSIVCSSCPAWRHETECREVAAMATDADRARHIAAVREKRGNEAADRLREDTWALMQAVA